MKVKIVYRTEVEMEIPDEYKCMTEIWPPTATFQEYIRWKYSATLLERKWKDTIPNFIETVLVSDCETSKTLYEY